MNLLCPHLYRAGVTPLAAGLLAASLLACASRPAPSPTHAAATAPLAVAIADQGPSPSPAAALAGPANGSLDAYVDYALRQSPKLRAALASWQAAKLAITPAGAWPEPTLSYGYFIRSVETRVGPQRHRFGIRQAIPWPGSIAAQTEAAAARARAAHAGYETALLATYERVARAYWALWLLRESQQIRRRERTVLLNLAAAVRARIEVGRATLADLGQVELVLGRIDHHLHGVDEMLPAARAALRHAIGADADARLPTPTDLPPPVMMPTLTAPALGQQAAKHPDILAIDHLAASADADSDRATRDRYPRITVGLDYIETGPAANPDSPDSGHDPIIATVALSLPIFQRAHRDRAASASARAEAQRARYRDAQQRAIAEVAAAVATLRHSAHSIDQHLHALIPQAEAVYGSVASSFETDRAALIAVLMAQRELLDLRLNLARARHDHAVAWATLAYLVGQPIEKHRPDPHRMHQPHGDHAAPEPDQRPAAERAADDHLSDREEPTP